MVFEVWGADVVRLVDIGVYNCAQIRMTKFGRGEEADDGSSLQWAGPTAPEELNRCFVACGFGVVCMFDAYTNQHELCMAEIQK